MRPKTLEPLQRDKEAAALNSYQAQLFIPQQQSPVYTESKSYKTSLVSDDWQDAVFGFTSSLASTSLRFDPSIAAGVFEISEVTLYGKECNTVFLQLDSKMLLESLKVAGDAFVLKNTECFLLYAFASDPIIYLPAIDVPECNLELKVRIRRIDDSKELRQIWKCHRDG